jgi:predicted MFS family arabinose efflux permease
VDAARETGADVSPQRARWVLGVLVVVYAVNFIDRNILGILLQPIKEDLGVSDTAMGLLTGPAFAVFYTAAGIPIARLADRGSRRTVMAIGLAFWSLATAASGLARSFAGLAAARIAVGVGEATATPAAHSILSDVFPPERRTRALAIYNMGASAGMFFGLLLGGWLQQAFGWRVAFAVVGLPGLAVALLVRLSIPETRRGGVEGRADAGEAPSLREGVRTLWSLPSYRYVCLAAGLYAMSAYGMLGWAPTMMVRVHAMPYAELGRNLAVVVGLGGAAGALLGGMLCDHLARQDVRWQVWVPALAGLVLMPFLAIFALAPDPDIALAAFVPVNLLNVVFAAPTYALAQGLARLRTRALASASVLLVLNLVGMGLGPLFVGVLNDALEPRLGGEAIRVSLLIVAGAGVLGVLPSLLAGRTLARDLAYTAAADAA